MSQFSEIYDRPRNHANQYSTNGTLTTTTTFSINSNIGRNGVDGYVICDNGDTIDVSFSSDGSVYSDLIRIKSGEKLSLREFDIHTLKLTHTGTDGDYRILVI